MSQSNETTGPIVSTSAGAPASLEQPQSLSRGVLILYALAICAVAIGYSFYTDHIWEDSLITLKAGENMVDGNGLSYHAGARVHTFTSPINVLMLALCYFLTGKTSYVATIWLYRVFSIAAFAGSGALLLQGAARAAPRWTPALAFLAIVYAFDIKLVAFSTNGMETAYLLLFLAWAVYLLAPPQPERWLARGLCWAGLMWSRPDACVSIFALMLAEYLFNGSAGRLLIRSFAKSAAICAMVYGPWFFGAWMYYGSPIPNTVLAKGNPGGTMAQLREMLNNLVELFFGGAAKSFRPIYSHFGPWFDNVIAEQYLLGVTMCLGILCAAYWAIPSKDRLGKIASFCFAVLCLYFSFQGYVYPWYLPPATLLGLVTLARAFSTLTDLAGQSASAGREIAKRVAVAVLGVLAISQLAVFGLSTWEMKIQQTEIEMGTRAKVGTWLREHSQPGDTVFLEPLGYIGYFSGLRMHDFPGLVSPEVVRLRREKGLTGAELILEIKPNWVVLRVKEYLGLKDSQFHKAFQNAYEPVQVFDSLPRLQKNYPFIPGKDYLYYDAQFAIFHRKPSATATP